MGAIYFTKLANLHMTSLVHIKNFISNKCKKYSVTVPLDDIGPQCGEEANHGEAEFVCTAQHQPGHDRYQRQLDVDPVPLAQYEPRDQNRKQRAGALHRFRERHRYILEGHQTQKYHQKPTTDQRCVIFTNDNKHNAF